MIRNLKNTIPLSQTMERKISALRQWARNHARPASNPPQPQPRLPNLDNGLRHLELG
jgi:hypothetical protein